MKWNKLFLRKLTKEEKQEFNSDANESDFYRDEWSDDNHNGNVRGTIYWIPYPEFEE
ncbi:hypothetical protein JXA27_06590 [Aerococcaceae bacterium zg-B36]|uniref:hypothetical protein n=1 Tax=Aerococcaceae bacterium zg-252 TaxID=2796928 RepID=UPI001BD8B833|nr:hypothetical protein [Aerococcaceae bacterium zg-B36]